MSDHTLAKFKDFKYDLTTAKVLERVKNSEEYMLNLQSDFATASDDLIFANLYILHFTKIEGISADDFKNLVKIYDVTQNLSHAFGLKFGFDEKEKLVTETKNLHEDFLQKKPKIQ